jgi:hypothetical protein
VGYEADVLIGSHPRRAASPCGLAALFLVVESCRAAFHIGVCAGRIPCEAWSRFSAEQAVEFSRDQSPYPAPLHLHLYSPPFVIPTPSPAQAGGIGCSNGQVFQLRQAHMRWGPRKLKRVLERDEPGRSWPAASTIGELLKREGLVVARKKRRKTAPYTEPLARADGPNRVWCADFKGWFRTGAQPSPVEA